MHDSSHCPVCRSQPAAGGLTDDEFHAFLRACRDELAAKQARFQQRIASAARWQCELAEGTLSFDGMIFGITPVGTYSEAEQTWLWAWANESLPQKARETSRPIQALFDRTGFRVFVDAGLPATASDAEDLTAMALHELGATGLFRIPSEGLTLYLAVHATVDPGDAGARNP